MAEVHMVAERVGKVRTAGRASHRRVKKAGRRYGQHGIQPHRAEAMNKSRGRGLSQQPEEPVLDATHLWSVQSLIRPVSAL